MLAGMTSYTLTREVPRPFDDVLAEVRAGLVEQGFGVISEIDLAGTLHAKLGVEVPPQVILGACRPQLAHEALQADPSVAAMLPCNVVVRSTGPSECVVEAFDPDTMVTMTGGAPALALVATDARARLLGLLDALA